MAKMKKAIIYIIMAILVINIASAISLTRELPSTSNVDSSFTMHIIVAGSTGNYGLIYSTDISGGCVSADGKTHISSFSFTSADGDSPILIKSPSSAGSCIFTGKYQLYTIVDGQPIEAPWVDFPTQSVSITGTTGNESCTPTTWTPDTSTICSTSTLTQTSNCGTTRIVSGTKTTGCEGCSCGGWTNQGCVGTSMRQTRACTPDVCMSESQFVADAICTSDEEEDSGGFSGGLIIALIVGVGIFFLWTRN